VTRPASVAGGQSDADFAAIADRGQGMEIACQAIAAAGRRGRREDAAMRRIMLAVLVLAWPLATFADERVLSFGRFGDVPVLWSRPQPAAVVLFVSGDAGISPNVDGMAHEFMKQGGLVVVISIWRYLHALDATKLDCTQPAQDFDALAHYVERTFGYPSYRVPVLVGFSSGATLVYAVLVESPPGMFRGAVGLGFCPDIPTKRPFCPGSGLAWGPGPDGRGFTFEPAASLVAPYVAFQGDGDTDCPEEATRAFMAKVHNGRMVEIHGTDHYFHARQLWIPKLASLVAEMLRTPVPGASAPSPPVPSR
jgi:type IV secretory pathway VirJ component